MEQRANLPRGLSEGEVEARRSQGLGNTPPPTTTRSYAQILRENVFNFINISIFVLGAALVMVGRPMDALLSVGIIFLNILVSVVQEVRAKRILDRVALLTRPQACVVRGGQEKQVPPEDLVKGDILKVGPGDQIVLDGALVFGAMAVDESQLTGESDLIRKSPGDEVFSGSFCVSGSGYYEAQKVGEDSLANKLTANARAYRRMVTPLQRQIGLAVRLILFMVIYLQILLVANNLLNAVPLPTGVAMATVFVSLVPNGLFLSIAIAYALAAVRMVNFGALLQQSNAVESLSNVDVLCLDKTGTLTTNKLHLDQVVAWQGTDDGAEADSRHDDGECRDAATRRVRQLRRRALALPKTPCWRCLSPLPASGAPWPSTTTRCAASTPWAPKRCCAPICRPLSTHSHNTSGDGPDAGSAIVSIGQKIAHYTDQGLRVLVIATILTRRCCTMKAMRPSCPTVCCRSAW